ncbi:MAG: hypothetical protein P8O90_00650 [Flavobacteriaceae bacterium]|nr:hypothetical protein [Flavobacteriaceae bacterium]
MKNNNRFNLLKKVVLLLLLASSFSYGQFTFYKPYEVEVTSDIPFGSLTTEIDQMRLGLEAQQWSVEVLKYWLTEMQKNPFITGDQKINFILYDSQKRRKILIPVPVKEKIVRAFKTEAGFQEHYIEFISETYEWLLENI